MLTLSAHQLGKRYIRQWIFRRLEYSFRQGNPCAVTGPNGSGKSTLLKVLSGFQPATEGSLNLQLGGKTIAAEAMYAHVALAAPYLELIEDFTLEELLRFHFSFKRLADGLSLRGVAERMYLLEAWQKPVKHFSSGMKQRLRLGLAFYDQSPLLLLDEPTSNLDEQGQHWYEQEIAPLLQQKLVIIASNQPQEYQFCTDRISIPDWKNM
ncbi:ABC transporter ATP-binding protein [Cesiribacter andamanensis]|uniref:Putative ABC transporter ATP-binding protein n=1 Tax=Cesiribacter andamanensis AMV16 TaxID=1279009 RepID=M7N0J2_9BACT|nr:ATP-binding cassette domain-containing protein [Cesiribacter andamanensis]EMR00807.1 putative ABC transporter ATP-binding protein [Cesiribacter andamanensis AMV16]